MGLIENIFKVLISHYKSMRATDDLGLCQFAPKGFDWQDLSGGALNIATY